MTLTDGDRLCEVRGRVADMVRIIADHQDRLGCSLSGEVLIRYGPGGMTIEERAVIERRSILGPSETT